MTLLGLLLHLKLIHWVELSQDSLPIGYEIA